MYKITQLNALRARLSTRVLQGNTLAINNMISQLARAQPAMSRFPLLTFATNNKNKDGEVIKEVTKPKKGAAKEKVTKESKSQKKADPLKTEEAQTVKTSDKIKADTSEKKISAKKKGKSQVQPEVEEDLQSKKQEYRLYTLKFNSPILPYAKFPLTQNKYIQDFLRKYEEDKDHIQKVIGVHFQSNSNDNAVNTVGIEIEITKRNNITIVESNSSKRYIIKQYDEISNFSTAVDYQDSLMAAPLKNNDIDPKYKDLLMSELYELKNIWFMFNKKINSMLVVLPQEILNRYDMVAKTLQAPTFDVTKYPLEGNFMDTFNEVVYKLAQYYFSIFQAIFTKDNEAVRPQIQEFLNIQDPIMRSRKIIYLFEELHSVIDKKLYYVQKTADEFKDRSKTTILEHAYQKVLEDSKQSEKTKFQEKLNAVKHMPESVRKQIQEEITSLEQKNDMDASRKIQYLNHVFRLPWDKRVEPYWDVQYSKDVIEKSHYGMKETKERILEFIAKNKRVNSQRGMVLLLTGPPGVGKTTIAKSIGDCLKRPTTVISMGGQNDPIHVKGSKRTYVDSQPGIFVKELQKLECKNPVIVIDEIDKIGFNSLKGDVSATLLELLNPEQSNTFRDNYLDLEFDFSECIFICTSNSTANMLQPLLDRIEIIHVPAYLPIEKINIAQQYLIPKFQEEYGFDRKISMDDIKITEAALIQIVNNYCAHEAGVRNLRKCIDRVFRKVVAKIEGKKIAQSELEAALENSNTQEVQEKQTNQESHHDSAATQDLSLFKEELPDKLIKEYQINSKNLENFLDVPMTDDNYYYGINKELPCGSANGLAYVDDGYGTVLKIQFVKKDYGKAEASKENDKEAPQGHLTHTGRLGEVMKESVEVVKIAVFNFLTRKDIAKDFDKNNYHLHVPMGATPKDGPSAGISLFAALVSIATNKPVLKNLALTGELTTLGEVISIGGVREKLTACKNHQITRVVLPASNRKHVSQLPDEFKKGFTVFYVKNIDQVHKICFESEGLHENKDYSQLRDMGIEIDIFADDHSSKIIEESEVILQRNFIEELLSDPTATTNSSNNTSHRHH